ncbi:hypothetical protein TRFO_40951 [Tritrichomonas foetus]|uniref:Uncharacterized protein n=1 Tax=Tritrichomonas foetus TaxID=1144522 RepID=A0A1J4J1R6_9EUKA|nr:hypothetical protein TRFO_40951 [Tritrichomonas foetus]|eukprot:OHS92713.1 hypothetical protein TRFO_40951 [Tritrichomonas foetus]
MKSSRRSSRKSSKDSRSRSRKALDEQEKLVVGAGWTAAATQHFIDLPTDDERLEHSKAMFSIDQEEYKYNIRATYTADFHFANGLFCLENNFDASQFQFVCRSIGTLFDMTVGAASSGEQLDVDLFRQQLLERFQKMFFEFNSEEFRFTQEQTADILKYVSTTFIRPIRLILRTYQTEPYVLQVLESRKIFVPPKPIPLSQFVEQFEEHPSERQFKPFYFPKFSGLSLADVREAMARYTDSIIETIDKRYTYLEEMVQKLNAQPAS